MFTRFTISFGLLSVLATPAWAYVYFGNHPTPTLRIDRPGGGVTSAVAYVDFVRMHGCLGGHMDYPVEQTLDLSTTYSLAIDAGAWCGLSVAWGSEVEITNGNWVVSYDESTTSVEIDTNPESVSVALSPFSVVSGTFSGYAPRLYITIAD